MNISERLRAETAEQHKAIENARRFSRLGSDDFTREEYVEMLERFYGYYDPLEIAFGKHHRIVSSLEYEKRFKLPLLQRDLIHFGHTPDSMDALPRCRDLPPTDTPAHAIGCIYVMEGSTHGAQAMARRLRAKFAPDGRGVAFYECYGPNTIAQWKAFKDALDNGFDMERDGDAIVHAATRTFETLRDWMNQ